MSSLDYVQWDITSACNLNCLHCREKVVEDFRDDLNIDECRKLIDQLVSFNTKTLSIAGGEPLLSHNIISVLYYAKDKFERLVISTNGTFLNDKLIRAILDCVTTVQISLDGANAETHDKIRGPGMFDKTIVNIKKLKELGQKVAIRLTLCDLNKNEVKQYVDLAKSLGLHEAFLRRIIPSGNAKENGLQPLSSKELKQVLAEAIIYGKLREVAVASADYFCQIEFNEEAKKRAEYIASLDGEVIGGCAIGVNSLYIMQNGLVVYCPYLPVFCGDLRQESLEKIWQNSEMLDVARNIRFNLKGKCAICVYKYACGGCRAYAYATSGDILAEDSGCWI